MTATTDDKRQQPIDVMADEFQVPEPVQNAADKYAKTMTAKNKANAKFTDAKESLLDLMGEHGLERVRVLLPGGDEKILHRVDEPKVKIEKPKKARDNDDE